MLRQARWTRERILSDNSQLVIFHTEHCFTASGLLKKKDFARKLHVKDAINRSASRENMHLAQPAEHCLTGGKKIKKRFGAGLCTGCNNSLGCSEGVDKYAFVLQC